MNYAVVFAGGIGARMMNTEIPKQFMEINHKPIIIYTLENFQNNINIDGIVISCIESWIPYLLEKIKEFNITKVCAVVAGGVNGQESIYHGLTKVSELTNNNCVVLIHDAVRPIINDELINQNINSVLRHGTGITCSQVTETIVKSENRKVIEDVNSRDSILIAKAPQSFFLYDILNVHEKAIKEGELNFIDSCSLMKYYGYHLNIVLGNYDNVKITTPVDYYMFKAMIETNVMNKSNV